MELVGTAGREESIPMSTINDPRTEKPWLKSQRPWRRRDGLFRFTINQFYQLGELGLFEDRHVELIRGMIYEMTTNPGHATSSELARDLLSRIFGAGWNVREMKPLDTGRRSLLEPDIAVVAGSIRDFARVHPTTAALVVEISETTLRKDRTIKAHLYAQAKLPDYWIVNLIDRQLEVHREPGTDPDRKGRFRYGSVTIVPESGTISPLAAPDSVVPVSDLLP
jgi:Uma2 family endonuclease